MRKGAHTRPMSSESANRRGKFPNTDYFASRWNYEYADKSSADYRWRKEIDRYLAADETTKSSMRDLYMGPVTTVSAVCRYLDTQWTPVAPPCAHATIEPDADDHWDKCTQHFDKFHDSFLEFADLGNAPTSVPASDDDLDFQSDSNCEPSYPLHRGATSAACPSRETTKGSPSADSSVQIQCDGRYPDTDDADCDPVRRFVFSHEGYEACEEDGLM